MANSTATQPKLVQTTQPVQPQPSSDVIYLPVPAPQGDLLTFLVITAMAILAKVLTGGSSQSGK